jgi:cell division protein FtsA
MEQTEEIFALDIGTRSVVGLVGKLGEQGFEVIDAEIVEHRTRAMLDGQIHDVDEVAKVVQEVKARLEERLGRPLHEVAVAAAGRALRTLRGQSSFDTFSLEEITRQQITELELAAVQQAQAALAEDGPEAYLYQCVGYSVVGYKLDGAPMTNLHRHRGSQITTEVIATFLPRSVVDSLYSVLKNCGMNMKTLTLEPIAALNVAIPPNMRTLNLTLVDIGAGTSDIALVSKGTVQNYAMVPMAGDEITEYLCNEYLLDFNTAEDLKRSLSKSDTVSFQDVLGMVQEKTTEEIISSLLPGVDTLAKAIAEKILALNTLSPAAVVFIGGGSLTPGLPEQVAARLGLPKQRVAVRGREVISQICGNLDKLQGPDCITPIGIAVTSVNDQALNLLHIEVNGRPVRLFSQANATVADALLASGFNLRKLHGRPGMAISVTVNGELVIFKGELGVSATIRRNGETVDSDSELQSNDSLEVIPARNGLHGKGTVRDAIQNFQEFNVRINGDDIKVVPRISMNDSLVSPHTALVDRAEIVWEPILSVGSLLSYLEVDPPSEEEMEVEINGQKRLLQYKVGNLLLNGEHADATTPLQPGDNLELVDEIYPRWRVRDISPQAGPVFIDITLNGQFRSLPGPRHVLQMNGKPVLGEEPLKAGDIIKYSTPQQAIIFSDLFKYIDFQPSPPAGKSRLIMQINGQAAEFTSIINNGDAIILDWE